MDGYGVRELVGWVQVERCKGGRVKPRLIREGGKMLEFWWAGMPVSRQHGRPESSPASKDCSLRFLIRPANSR